MLLLLAAFVALVLGVHALLDLLRTPPSAVGVLPKPLWALVVVLLPVLGPLAWRLAGRGAAPVPPPAAAVAPDDDEEFLRALRRRAEEQRRAAERGDDPPAAAS